MQSLPSTLMQDLKSILSDQVDPKTIFKSVDSGLTHLIPNSDDWRMKKAQITLKKLLSELSDDLENPLAYMKPITPRIIKDMSAEQKFSKSCEFITLKFPQLSELVNKLESIHDATKGNKLTIAPLFAVLSIAAATAYSFKINDDKKSEAFVSIVKAIANEASVVTKVLDSISKDRNKEEEKSLSVY